MNGRAGQYSGGQGDTEECGITHLWSPGVVRDITREMVVISAGTLAVIAFGSACLGGGGLYLWLHGGHGEDDLPNVSNSTFGFAERESKSSHNLIGLDFDFHSGGALFELGLIGTLMFIACLGVCCGRKACRSESVELIKKEEKKMKRLAKSAKRRLKKEKKDQLEARRLEEKQAWKEKRAEWKQKRFEKRVKNRHWTVRNCHSLRAELLRKEEEERARNQEAEVSTLGESGSWYTGSDLFDESSLTSYCLESPEAYEEGLMTDAEIHAEDGAEDIDST